MVKQPKKSTKKLANAIETFLQELPNPITSMQSFFLKELLLEDKKITLLAQKHKSVSGMAWNVNVSQYHNN